jgi:pilus assembly protein CpaF
MRDGIRRVTEVVEVIGLEGEVITLGTLFAYKFEGENPDGTLRGTFEGTQIRPRFLPRLDYFGLGSAFLKALGVQKDSAEA